MNYRNVKMVALALALVSWLTAGCGSSKPYTAATHDGRIYLIGNKDTLASFKETGHLPYTKTFLGAGPDGETIVAEVMKDDPTYANRLIAAYYDDHYFYQEVIHDGRIYILGTPETYASFKTTGHLPYTQTFIGAGPNGETIVVENEKSGSKLRSRLITHYEIKHNTLL